MTVIYGSSGIGEPAYSGGIYSPDAEALNVATLAEATAPVVELGLTYDPEPTVAGLGYKIPGWLLLVAGVYIVANRIGGRI